LRLPGWYAMFSRHIRKGREGYEWSVNSMVAGLGSAITAALGGILAERLGFDVLFLIIGFLSIFGSIVLIFLYSILNPDHQN